MAVVRMHQAKDGSLHKTAALCSERNIQLRLAPAVDAFVNKLGPDNFVDADAVGPITSGLYLDLANLPALLITHSAELRKLFNDAMIDRKGPRKAKDGQPAAPRKPRASKPAAEEKPATPAQEKPVVPEIQALVAAADDPLDDVLASLGE